jgi:alpha-beta hydrolase superfamily lysophospholipase
MFHGYIASKSTMLERAEELYKMGYDLLLVDFMGSGGSEGYESTIGYKEGREVRDVYEYLRSSGERNIYLFGTSMGAAAILKAMDQYPDMEPKGIILECPFGSMYQTVCARFGSMGAPTFPMAALLVFWGGAINGFWAFGHNPAEYAKAVECPTLLLCGGEDERVSRGEIDDIYANLQGEKQLRIYSKARHESYLNKYRREWLADIRGFLH